MAYAGANVVLAMQPRAQLVGEELNMQLGVYGLAKNGSCRR